MAIGILVLWLFSRSIAVGAPPAEQAQVRYLDLPESARPRTLAADSSGNLFIVSDVTEPSGRSRTRVIKTNPQGSTLASIDFGEGEAIAGAATDSTGNLVIAGTTSSPDFPLVAPLIATTSQTAAFVVKIDSQLKSILFSTRLGGTHGGFYGTSAGAVALDNAGNIYITGSTSDTDFPVTTGAFQTQPPQGDSFGTAVYAYLTEISADGARIIFSTYFGDSRVSCIGGSHCIGVFGDTNATAIALDSGGNVVISGRTTANQLPATPGVYAQQCGCSSDLPAGFAAKFASGGAKLTWATYLPLMAFGNSQINVAAIALDGSGNVIVGGSLATLGTLGPGFVIRLDAAATRIISTYFGTGGLNPPTNQVSDLVLDSQGAIWIAGNSGQAPPGTTLFGSSYLAALSSDGMTIANLFPAPPGAAGQAIAASGGNVIALGSAPALLVASPASGSSLLGIANSAGFQVSNAVAPDELISLYGVGIGPAVPVYAQVVNNVVTTSLGGVQVLFDGVPAPLLYAGPNQINALVPGEVSGRDNTTLQIVTPAGTINGPIMLVRPSEPGVFHSQAIDSASALPFAAALNQDGSVNSAANPAAYGSVVTVWATGGGATGGADGMIITTASGGPSSAISALGSAEGNPARSLEVLYAGNAPGAVAGVLQVNFRLPMKSNLNLVWTFQLQIGDALSQTFEIYLEQ